MALAEFEVVAGAGSLRSSDGVTFPHRWTSEGVSVTSEFTGGHLYHLAAAGCVLNDVYREANGTGIELRGVRVSARGALDTETWQSTGIEYRIEVDSDADPQLVGTLLDRVDEVAEIPKALRAGTTVERRPAAT